MIRPTANERRTRTTPDLPAPRYADAVLSKLRRGPLTRRLLAQAPAALAVAGVSVLGTHLLSVRGTDGRTRVVVVEVLRHRGLRYLVSTRGTVPWVRHLRVTGEAELRVGRRNEPVRAVEVPVADRPPVLRAHLRRWRPEGAALLDGVGVGASDSELLRISSSYPVFRIEPVPGAATER